MRRDNGPSIMRIVAPDALFLMNVALRYVALFPKLVIWRSKRKWVDALALAKALLPLLKGSLIGGIFFIAHRSSILLAQFHLLL